MVNSDKYRWRKQGFTLIELLVVISIIALLLAILVPSLSKVRLQARNALCKSHLHQQGIAFHAYSATWEKYPPSAKGESAWWPFLLGSWHGSNPHDRDAWYPAAQGALIVTKLIDDPYFLYCPAAPVKRKQEYIGRADQPVTFTYHWLRCYFPDNPKWNWGYGLGDPVWGPWSSYSYWAGYNLPGRLWTYKKRLEKGAAKNHLDRSDKIITNDMTVTAPVKYAKNGVLETLENTPVWSNHVVNGKLKGGNLLYNDGSVGWSNFRDMAKEPDPHLRAAFLDTSVIPYNGSCYWF